MTFWATRPRVRALWTVVMGVFGLAVFWMRLDDHLQPYVNVALVLVWAAGMRSARWLMRLVASCSPAFWGAIWLLRRYLAALAFVLVWTGRSKPAPESVGWSSKFDGELLVREVRGRAWVGRTFDAIQSVTPLSALFLTPLVWVLNLVPYSVPTKSAIPVGNYTLD